MKILLTSEQEFLRIFNMPVIKEYSYDFDFKVQLGEKPGLMCYFYLSKGLFVEVPIDAHDQIKCVPEKTKYSGLRVDDNYGLMTWDSSQSIWCPLVDEIQEAYTTFQADKILLDKK
jgi:hypothetical protein